MDSLRDLLEVGRNIDHGIASLLNELKNPMELIYSRTEDKRRQAENELHSVAKEVRELKNKIDEEVDIFESFVKESEDDRKTSELFFDKMFHELKDIEAGFTKFAYVPFKFQASEYETNGSTLSNLSTDSFEQIDNISPVPNVDISPEETYVIRRFNPSLNSTLLNTGNGNTTTDIFNQQLDASAYKIEGLKTNSNLKTPSISSRRIPSSQRLLTPTDPGCSLLSLEVTGRSVRRFNGRKW